MSVIVDLNCDMGEGYPDDETLMGLVSSANIACGGHAGDELTMRAAVRLCRKHGVAVGAHPSIADREGFGRRVEPFELSAIGSQVADQVASLMGVALAEGVPLCHVKLHGALYSLAARDLAIGASVLTALRRIGECRTLYTLAGSPFVGAARVAGWRVAEEAFPDRSYRADGSLAPRAAPGALIGEPREVARRALRMVRDGRVGSVDGADVVVHADTICIHGDEPHAVESARAIRALFADQGISVKRFGAA